MPAATLRCLIAVRRVNALGLPAALASLEFGPFMNILARSLERRLAADQKNMEI